MTPHARLKRAREAAGYKSAGEAARALGVARATYAQHESGRRQFGPAKAEQYATFFSGYRIVDYFLCLNLTIPEREVLAALIFDTTNTPHHFSDAPSEIAETYRTTADTVYRAFGLSGPPEREKALEPA